MTTITPKNESVFAGMTLRHSCTHMVGYLIAIITCPTFAVTGHISIGTTIAIRTGNRFQRGSIVTMIASHIVIPEAVRTTKTFFFRTWVPKTRSITGHTHITLLKPKTTLVTSGGTGFIIRDPECAVLIRRTRLTLSGRVQSLSRGTRLTRTVDTIRCRSLA